MKYQNPILRGSHPDPSICRVKDKYYLVNSSFEYLPGLPIYQSKDLVNWNLTSYGITIDNAKFYPYNQIKSSLGIFAPTIRYYQGIFYLICTFVGKGTFIIESNDLLTGWSEPHWIKEIKGIDPSLTFVENKCYVQFTNEGKIYQCEINPHEGKVIGKLQIISSGTGGRDPEGPHVYYQFGKYWLLTAEGGTREGHMVNMQVSDNIWGPYQPVKNNPILTNRNYKGELQCVGHADIVKTQNNQFELVALSVREPKHIHLNLLGRETILLPVDWTRSGIKVNGSGIATIELNDPLEEVEQTITKKFDRDEIISPFSYPQIKLSNDQLSYSLSPVKRNLHSLVGVRQKEFNGKFSFKIDLNIAERSGLVVYKDDMHLFSCIYDPKQKKIIFHKQNSDLIVEKENSLDRFTTGLLKFELCFDKEKYQIQISSKNTSYEETMLTRHLTCEESDSPFTGVTIGILSLGKEKCDFYDLDLNYKD